MFWKLRKEEKQSQINSTLSDQDLFIAIAVKNKHTKLKKKKKEKKENKTKQNKEQLKWKVEQGILCSQ